MDDVPQVNMLSWIRRKLKDKNSIVYKVAFSADHMFYHTLGLGGTMVDRAIVAPVKQTLLAKHA